MQSMSGAPPTLHDIAAAKPITPPEMYVWRFNTVPLTPLKADFILAMQKSGDDLCRKSVDYFNDEFSEPGVLWFLHNDAEAAARAQPPRMDSLLALAFTTHFKGEDVFYVDVFCATKRSTKGTGKTLFDVLAKHAAGLNYKTLELYPASSALRVKVYQDAYGMSCPGLSDCVLQLSAVPHAIVPAMVSVSLAQLQALETPATKKALVYRSPSLKRFLGESDSGAAAASKRAFV